MRTCGKCTLCCTVMAVQALDKPAGTACPHACRGCAIYAERPGACRAFECVWLSSQAPSRLRPDRIHGMLAATPDGSLVLHEEPGWPGHAFVVMREALQAFISDGKHYVVVRGQTPGKATFYGATHLLPKAAAMVQETVAEPVVP